MRKLFILITGYGFLFFLSSIAAAGATVSFEVNGLKVILRQNIGSDVVAAGLYLRGGATYISTTQAGIENMALSVAQKATKNFPKDQLNAALESMNTRISHSMNKDYSSLNMQCVLQNFKSSWRIFSDILINPSFTSEDVELERKRIQSAIRQRTDDPDNYIDQLCSEAFFINHPYMTNVRGTLETISAFSPEQLNEYLRSRMKTSHLLLVVAGNISQSDLDPLVRETFKDFETGEYIPHTLPEVWPSQPTVKVVYRDIPTNYVQGYFTAPTYASEERLAMLMASRILYQRVFEEVRTKRSLSYAPAAGIGGNFSNFAMLYVSAVDADSAIRVMCRELDRIKNEKVRAKLLSDQINQTITRYYRGIETNASQVNVLARYELSGAGYQQSEKFKERLTKLNPQDIQQVCQKYIKNIQFVLLGNPDKLNVQNFLYGENM